LSLLASGPLPPRPADILGSRRMEQIIARRSGMADKVLFATPPVIAATDAAVLATRVDCVLLVFHAGKTRRDRFRRKSVVLEEALAMARMAVADGIRVLAATPHSPASTASRKYSPALVRERADQLIAALAAEDVPLEIVVGTEITFVADVVEQLRRGELLTYG